MLFVTILLLNVAMISAILETSKPINLDKDNKLDFDGKKIDYNSLWLKYKPLQVNTWLDIPMISKTTAEMYINKINNMVDLK